MRLSHRAEGIGAESDLSLVGVKLVQSCDISALITGNIVVEGGAIQGEVDDLFVV